jgi:hypothetical protein
MKTKFRRAESFRSQEWFLTGSLRYFNVLKCSKQLRKYLYAEGWSRLYTPSRSGSPLFAD